MRDRLLLFAMVFIGAAFGLGVGGLGYWAFDWTPVSVGMIGQVGTAAMGVVAYRRGLYGSIPWYDRLIWLGPVLGLSMALVMAGGIWRLPVITTGIVGATASGLSALLSRYILHFFDSERPQSILRTQK